MKRKKVLKKAEEVKQEEVKVKAEPEVDAAAEEASEQEQPNHQPRSPWDDLVFMRPAQRAQAQTPSTQGATEGTEVQEAGTTPETATTAGGTAAETEKSTEEKPAERSRRQGWSWI